MSKIELKKISIQIIIEIGIKRNIFSIIIVILITNRMVLVKFLNDSSVQPIESQWFQFYTPNQAKEIQEFWKSNAAVSSKMHYTLLCTSAGDK